jgi:hypothetical protein
MTSVNVTTTEITVDVTAAGSTTVVQVPQTTTVTAVTEGPIGPAGPGGLVVDTTAKVDQSLVYYDATAATFKADALWTVPTLSDGGNY